MKIPGRVRDFLHDRAVEAGIFAAVGMMIAEMLLSIQAMAHIAGAREAIRSWPIWVWAIAPVVAGFFAWLKLHDLPPSEEVQKIIDANARKSSQFASAERTRAAMKRGR